MLDDQIHWFSIINSLMIVLFLSGMVAMIMMRTLHRDISKYNQLETADEAQEETGWKLVSPPSCFACFQLRRKLIRSAYHLEVLRYYFWLQTALIESWIRMPLLGAGKWWAVSIECRGKHVWRSWGDMKWITPFLARTWPSRTAECIS